MQLQQCADRLVLLLVFVVQAIARDVGPREMTVRQMLHSAALRSRQPSITAAAADHLVRMSLTESPLEGVGSLLGASPRASQQQQQLHFNGDVERGLPLESVGSTTGTGSFQRPAAASAVAHPPSAAAAPSAAPHGELKDAGRTGS